MPASTMDSRELPKRNCHATGKLLGIDMSSCAISWARTPVPAATSPTKGSSDALIGRGVLYVESNRQRAAAGILFDVPARFSTSMWWPRWPVISVRLITNLPMSVGSCARADR